MLKLLTPINPVSAHQTKCGEIFYQDFNNFSMICTFCEMKFFNFEEFLLHIQNIHLENYIQLDFKTEDEIEEVLRDDVEQYEDSCDFEAESSVSEQELLMVLKKPKKKREIKRRKRGIGKGDYTNRDTDSDELEILFQTSHHKTEENVSETSISKTKKLPKVQEFSCPDCQQIFNFVKDLTEHVINCHNGYKCSQCDSRFRLPHHLRRHELLHNDEKFPCPIENCGKIYKAEEYLKRHLEVHTLPQTFVCKFNNCGKAYETQSRLNVHHSRAHSGALCRKKGDKVFVCDTCGFICTAYSLLTIHQRRHTGEKPFACEICDKRFALKGYLKLHMVTHSNIRQYVCEICQAAFTTPGVLQRHKFIHSDEKTFQCKLCDKAFKQPHGLDGHMRRLHMEPKVKEDADKLKIFQM